MVNKIRGERYPAFPNALSVSKTGRMCNASLIEDGDRVDPPGCG
jgi:hypothetical protein